MMQPFTPYNWRPSSDLLAFDTTLSQLYNSLRVIGILFDR
jgi:hypothetical protein